jgi:hypothetical protein
MSAFASNTSVSSNGRKFWFLWTALLLTNVTAQIRNQNNDTNEIHRRLQVEDGGVSSTTGDSRARYVQKVYITATILTKFTLSNTDPSLNLLFFAIHYSRNLQRNLTV